MNNRRRFLTTMTRLGLAAGLGPLVLRLLEGEAHAAEGGLHPASYWHAEADRVVCDLCPHQESLGDGDLGICRVRQNRGGSMVTHGYDQPCILNIDPIEKNPLTHVLPGSSALAVAHAGCNLRCLYCQNWEFSQKSPTQTRNLRDFDQQKTIGKAKARELRCIVFTYTEATNSIEFVTGMARLARSSGLTPTLCTGGFVNEKPFDDVLAPFAAATITFKGPTEEFYGKVCGGRLKPVLETMVRVKAAGKWLEVATLIVPTLNDETGALVSMASWIVKNLGAETPWHLERFMPQYKLRDLPETPQATLERARKIGLEAGLKYVYISNVAPHEGNHTYCPGCGKAVIKRLGFKVLSHELAGGQCPGCQHRLPGLWA
ncbi:MAG: AmmeMemoRadiSam system radical SAM enzyme [Candidatus Riflebacteria bacterium]|nr:AmmeMemoRadiSam system radical SAM enzyme [Candidatus Riflebacteria bacterium]